MNYKDYSIYVPNAIGVILNLLCFPMRDLYKSRTKGIKINPLKARANTTLPQNTSQEETLI